VDRSEQQDKYETMKYEGGRKNFESFCSQKLEQIPEIEATTLSEEEEHERLRKCKVNEEKFLTFALERHPNHPAYAKYIEDRILKKLKKQKMNERTGKKNICNSPPRTKIISRTEMHL
jgi:hypothetical protein